MKMTRLLVLLAMMASMFAGFGCASRSAVSELRWDNVIAYTHDVTGDSVSVTVDPPYVYREFTERSFEGVEVEGYLFVKNETDTILVTRMVREDFEQLVGSTLDVPMTGVTSFPPKSIFEAQFCELVRAYVVTLEKDVVAVVRVKGLNPEKKPCEPWTNLDDVTNARPDVVNKFDKSADAAIRISWK